MPDPPLLPDQGRPDPSQLSQEAIGRAVAAERDYTNGQLDVLRARLSGIDEASKVLHETVTRTPTDIQQAIGHVTQIMDERFTSTATQFKERDTRSERESRDNKVAVDAAFAAQKEAAAKQDESNGKAIDKSESSTKEKIDKLTELFRTEILGLTNRLDDLKERIAATDRRVGEISVTATNAAANRTDNRAGTSQGLMAAALVMSGLAIVVTVALALMKP